MIVRAPPLPARVYCRSPTFRPRPLFLSCSGSVVGLNFRCPAHGRGFPRFPDMFRPSGHHLFFRALIFFSSCSYFSFGRHVARFVPYRTNTTFPFFFFVLHLLPLSIPLQFFSLRIRLERPAFFSRLLVLSFSFFPFSRISLAFLFLKQIVSPLRSFSRISPCEVYLCSSSTAKSAVSVARPAFVMGAGFHLMRETARTSLF